MHAEAQWLGECNDDFAGWDKDEPKRQAFLGRLLSIIKRRTRFRSACPCLPEIMSMLSAIYPLHETGRNAYVLCGLSVIEFVGEWAKAHLEPDVVGKFVFEAGANGAGRLITDMDRLGRLSEIGFLKKCDVGALQAADLDAYEQGNFLGDIEKWIQTATEPYDLKSLADKTRSPFQAGIERTRGKSLQIATVNLPSIERLCKRLDIKSRGEAHLC